MTYAMPVFKTGAIGHSAIPPGAHPKKGSVPFISRRLVPFFLGGLGDHDGLGERTLQGRLLGADDVEQLSAERGVGDARGHQGSGDAGEERVLAREVQPFDLGARPHLRYAEMHWTVRAGQI